MQVLVSLLVQLQMTTCKDIYIFDINIHVYGISPSLTVITINHFYQCFLWYVELSKFLILTMMLSIDVLSWCLYDLNLKIIKWWWSHSFPLRWLCRLLLTITRSNLRAFTPGGNRTIRFTQIAFDRSGQQFLASDQQGNLYQFNLAKNK